MLSGGYNCLKRWRPDAPDGADQQGVAQTAFRPAAFPLQISGALLVRANRVDANVRRSGSKKQRRGRANSRRSADQFCSSSDPFVFPSRKSAPHLIFTSSVSRDELPTTELSNYLQEPVRFLLTTESVRDRVSRVGGLRLGGRKGKCSHGEAGGRLKIRDSGFQDRG